MGETVSVDLSRAMQLSRACLDAAIHIRRETELLLVDLREAGEDPFVLGAALRASEWAGGGTCRVAAVVEAVATASPPRARAGMVPWSSPAGRVDDAGTAASSGAEAVAALRDGDADRLVRLLRDWGQNPSFNEAFGSLLEVSDLVPWLVLAAEPDAHVANLDAGISVLDLVGLLANALSAATVEGDAPFSMDEPLDSGVAEGLTPLGVAMLFAAPGGSGASGTTDRRWSRSWLVDAMTLLVVPLTAQMRTGDVRSVGRRWGDDLIDLRASIFAELARDPATAQLAFLSVDMGTLLGASAHYLDHGAALTDALVAATRPTWLGDRRAERVMNRFVDGLSSEEPPPLDLHERLGEIAWPWVGSFRVDRADGRTNGIANPLPALGEAALRRYVALVGTSRRATGELLDGLDVWVSFQLAASGAMPLDPAALHDIGSVSRFVSEATRDHQRSEAARTDAEREGNQKLLELAGNGIGALVGRWWGDAADFLISNVAVPEIGVPLVLPDLDAEIEYLASVPVAIARDQELLEWRVLAHLWGRREENGLFAPFPPPPASVLDSTGQLASPATFDAAAWTDFRMWRDLVADATGLDNVGAAFGRDLPPASDGSDDEDGGG